MNKYRKIIVFLTICLLFFSATITSANLINKDKETNIEKIETNKEEVIADWTLIHYLCLDNHHESYELEQKMNDFKEIGSNDDFNLIVAEDGVETGDSAIFYVEKNNAVNISTEFNWPKEVDMGSPYTVKSLIENVKENYPSKHYGIIFYTDYGSGWQGVCRDTNNGKDNGLPLMTIPELANVFKEISNEGFDPFDLVVIRTCISGSLETAYELYPYVKYVVFSQEHMLEPLDKGPEYIFQYKKSTWYLKNNTNTTPEKFAEKMVEFYNPTDFPLWVLYTYEIIYKKGEMSPFLKLLSNIITKFLNNLKNPDYHVTSLHTTLSAIELSKLSNLKESLNSLTEKLILHSEEPEIINALENARKNVRSYGHFYPKTPDTSSIAMIFLLNKITFGSYIDLYNFIELLKESIDNQEIKNLCKNVMTDINNSVVKNTCMENDESHGYSIYFPEEKELYNRYIWNNEFDPNYEGLRFSKETHWDEFLKTYLKI
jgi:hypothetical protein